jgi:hypothetical protein
MTTMYERGQWKASEKETVTDAELNLRSVLFERCKLLPATAICWPATVFYFRASRFCFSPCQAFRTGNNGFSVSPAIR